MLHLNFKLRISLTFFGITTLIATLIFIFFYTQTVQDHVDWLRDDLKNVTTLAASHINTSEIAQVSLEPGCEKAPIYQKLVKNLKEVVKMDGRVSDAYVLVPSGKKYILRFVVNADRELTPVGCGEEFDISNYFEMQKAFVAPSADRKPIRDKWGSWFSAYAPIYNGEHNAVAVLGLDIAEQTLKQLEGYFLGRYFLFMILILVISFAMGFLLSRWLTRPLEQIISSMEKVAEGNLDHRLHPASMTEFIQIGKHFNKMTDSLQENMKELTNTIRRQERVSRELEIAADLQSRALPAGVPTIPGLEVAAKSFPATQVGGDYYDFITVSDHETGFVIADATGKGFSGALYMTNSRSVFHVVSQTDKTPANILFKTNNVIANEAISGTGLFITLFYGCYDQKSGKLVYANAGHNPPLYFHSKTRTCIDLKARSAPIGIVANQEFPEETVQMEKNDFFLLYTDGVIEAKNPEGDMFTLERLKVEIELVAEKNAGQILKHLQAVLFQYMNGREQYDDMTLVVVKKRE